MTMAHPRATARIQSDTVDEIAVITRACDEYPAQLAAVPSAPDVLYDRGHLVADDALAVAVVGSRRATPYGLEVSAGDQTNGAAPTPKTSTSTPTPAAQPAPAGTPAVQPDQANGAPPADVAVADG